MLGLRWFCLCIRISWWRNDDVTSRRPNDQLSSSLSVSTAIFLRRAASWHVGAIARSMSTWPAHRKSRRLLPVERRRRGRRQGVCRVYGADMRPPLPVGSRQQLACLVSCLLRVSPASWSTEHVLRTRRSHLLPRRLLRVSPSSVPHAALLLHTHVYCRSGGYRLYQKKLSYYNVNKFFKAKLTTNSIAK